MGKNSPIPFPYTPVYRNLKFLKKQLQQEPVYKISWARVYKFYMTIMTKHILVVSAFHYYDLSVFEPNSRTDSRTTKE